MVYMASESNCKPMEIHLLFIPHGVFFRGWVIVSSMLDTKTSDFSSLLEFLVGLTLSIPRLHTLHFICFTILVYKDSYNSLSYTLR